MDPLKIRGTTENNDKMCVFLFFVCFSKAPLGYDFGVSVLEGI